MNQFGSEAEAWPLVPVLQAIGLGQRIALVVDHELEAHGPVLLCPAMASADTATGVDRLGPQGLLVGRLDRRIDGELDADLLGPVTDSAGRHDQVEALAGSHCQHTNIATVLLETDDAAGATRECRGRGLIVHPLVEDAAVLAHDAVGQAVEAERA